MAEFGVSGILPSGFANHGVYLMMLPVCCHSASKVNPRTVHEGPEEE
jgi:hypothetical protein